MGSLLLDTKALVKENLMEPDRNLKIYFPLILINSNRAWIRNPFSINSESETDLSDAYIDSLIEL